MKRTNAARWLWRLGSIRQDPLHQSAYRGIPFSFWVEVWSVDKRRSKI